MRHMCQRTFKGFSIATLAIGLLCACAPAPEGPAGMAPMRVWHSFASSSREEGVFLAAIERFREEHPSVPLNVSYVRYLELVPTFITASQGGEAPDLIRLSHDHLGEIAHIRVGGLPLLEDLRPHLTPVERLRYDPRAMQAMRHEASLLALPATQSCLSLLFNRTLFDAKNIDYPNDDWRTDDFLRAASALTDATTYGLAVPTKWSYWWTPFQTGFGGRLFGNDLRPTLDSSGSASAMDYYLGLELVHGVVPPGVHPESMKTLFMQGKTAMVVDGPWNWGPYLDSGIDVGQSLLPVVSETGLRMAPLLTFHGWSLSKDSLVKADAVKLALWLTSAPVQLEFARETFSLPTARRLLEGPELENDPALTGFMQQTQVCVPAPTSRATSLVYEPLDAALAMVHQGAMSAEEALYRANQQLLEATGG